LRAAEQWLTEAGADKERQPTALQTAYIIASRKAAARRQRITLGAVSFGLVVAMLLAILAYLSRQESHRRLVGATVMAGQERVDRGDLFDALPYFVEALKLDLSDQLREPLHRVRLGTTFRQLPQLAAAFFHHNQIGTAELSADGEWLLTTADEPAATLRHLADGGERELKLAERVSVGAFSANGRYVVLRGQKSEAISSMLTPLKGWKDAGAQVWEVATGAPVSPILPDLSGEALTLSSDGQWIAAARGTDAVVWNLKAEQAGKFAQGAAVKTLAFDALGTQLLAVTEGNTATVWDLRTGSRKDLPRETKAWRAWFSHDGQQVLVSGGRVWKLANLTSVSLDTTSSLNSAAFSPDDRRIVVGTGEYPIEGDGSARVFDAATGRALTPALPHGEDVTCTAFSANGQWVATGSRDGTARIWNAGTGLPETPPLRHLGAVTSVQFAEAKGKHLLLSASNDGTVRLWKFGEQKEVTITTPGSAWFGTFSPDGEHLALGGFDGTDAPAGLARIYAGDGTAASPPLSHRVPLGEVRFSTDGARLITKDWSGDLSIWNQQGQNFGASHAPRAVDLTGRQIVEFGEEGLVFVRDLDHGNARELLGAGGSDRGGF
jgi:WD40 repeat protein